MMKSALVTAGLMLSALPAFAAVEGQYASDCIAVQTASATLTFDFGQEDLTQVQRAFLDKKCKSAAYDLALKGPYKLDAEAGALDYTLEAVTLTPLSSQIASAFNAQKFCGLKGWTKDKAQVITGLTCSGQKMPEAGSQSFDIVKEVDGGIQLGKPSDDADGSTAEKRPTEVDSSITYHSVTTP